MESKKIILITSGQPSANPRLVKEAITLFESGYAVSVVYSPISIWADQFDLILFKQYPLIKWICAGYHPVSNKWMYRYVRLRQYFFKRLYSYFGNRFGAALRSMVLFSQELEREAKKQNGDLYIGHNLGAIAAVIKAAKFYNAKAAFDFEDYHRGEDKERSPHWIKTTLIEAQYVPYLTYATCSSGLIANEIQLNFPALKLFVINNSFSVKYMTAAIARESSKPISLFWFSQTIGKGRGLEDIISTLQYFTADDFELYLMGNCSEANKRYFLNLCSSNNQNKIRINFLKTVAPENVFSVASSCDIGLALEPGRDLNNRIALSNKIFTYLLAGNALILSDTPAQKEFFTENSSIGFLYPSGNSAALAERLKVYLKNPEILLQQKNNARQIALQLYNWELESEKLLAQINSTINNA